MMEGTNDFDISYFHRVASLDVITCKLNWNEWEGGAFSRN